ncbi:MAG: polyphenol oxidase family protein [Candidatus Hydrogenedentes bacterium]|nr:polyphenol oxidase family protein [Candidatus Hydrogenedentota bacterium]
MIRFTSLEKSGLSVAAMSGREEGDCGIGDNASANVTAFLRALSLSPGQLFRVRQVHGIRVVEAVAIREGLPADFPEADGMITNCPGVVLGICVADCAPVLLYNPVIKAVAALHAGREGICHDIVSAGIHALCTTYGGFPDQLQALIGPCAGGCCYEVSREMADIWSAAGRATQGRNLHLSLEIQHQLENNGVIRHNIEVVASCTVCGGNFYSYRADGTPHRNLVVVML